MLEFQNTRSSQPSCNFTVKCGLALLLALPLLTARVHAADINVGPTRSVTTLAGGVAIAQPGDRVLLDAGTYVDDTAVVRVPITIEGAGNGAILQITQTLANRKGILIGDATLTVRNITFQGAFISQADGNNGAGIRMETGDLTIDTCTFLNNQNGVLVNPNNAATVTVSNSHFIGNGAGDGYSHAIYVNEVAQFTVTGSTFTGTKVGHSIKSRALATTVRSTVIDDGVTGSSSYAIDLPNGGAALIDNVQITQGVNTQNPTMIAYGEEGNLKVTNSMTISNSTFVNQLQSPSAVAVYNWASGVSATLTNDTFQGLATTLRGLGTNSAATSTTVTHQNSVFSTAQDTSQSYLRFYNSGTASGTVTITLYDGISGKNLMQWQSPQIPPNAAPQLPISAIETAATQPFAKPAFYALAIVPTFTGSFQHVLFRPSDGMLANLTVCDTGISDNGAKLANVHSSRIADWPSSISIYNTGPSANAVTLGIYDARDGTSLGSYVTAPVAAGGQSVISMASIEAATRIAPPPGLDHYTIRVQSPFTGVLQHVVRNQRSGAVVDMTPICPLAPGA